MHRWSRAESPALDHLARPETEPNSLSDWYVGRGLYTEGKEDEMTRPVAPSASPRVAEEADLVGCIPNEQQQKLLGQWQETKFCAQDLRAAGFAALADALQNARNAGG